MFVTLLTWHPLVVDTSEVVVGSVQRSETHRNVASVRWVARRSTHRTDFYPLPFLTCIRLIRLRHFAFLFIPFVEQEPVVHLQFFALF